SRGNNPAEIIPRRLPFQTAATQSAEKLEFCIRTSLHSLRKNSDQSRFWEGHEFTRAVKSLEMCLRFSARGVLFAARRVFPQAVQRCRRFFELRCPFRGWTQKT